MGNISALNKYFTTTKEKIFGVLCVCVCLSVCLSVATIVLALGGGGRGKLK